ncbi:MAG: hypothetical protein WA299_13515, partial [Candidatus Acidiferrum sp.]
SFKTERGALFCAPFHFVLPQYLEPQGRQSGIEYAPAFESEEVSRLRLREATELAKNALG